MRYKMRHKLLSTGIAIVATVGLMVGYQPTGSKSASAQAGTDCQIFAETGKSVCGWMLQYWNDHGGLRQQGFPISDQFQEASEIDGKIYPVQYFERAKFELHSDTAEKGEVLLSLLGVIAMQDKYHGDPPTSEDTSNAGQLFPETGYSVSGEFLDYWNANGGLAQQGYPISGRFTEKSDLNGQSYTVQYFERAVFELHPENDAANRVLLSQLGTMRFKQEYPNGDPDPGAVAIVQVGWWGGNQATLDVQATRAHIELPCAHADIAGVLVTRDGKIDMGGTFVQEHGGPAAGGDLPTRPARFTGTVSGTTLTLTITLTDDNSVVGTYKVTLGDQGRVVKCM
jgi:hypothetical protein